MTTTDWRRPLPAETIIGYAIESDEVSLFLCADPCFVSVVPEEDRAAWTAITVADCQTSAYQCDHVACCFSSWYGWPIQKGTGNG